MKTMREEAAGGIPHAAAGWLRMRNPEVQVRYGGADAGGQTNTFNAIMMTYQPVGPEDFHA